MSATVHEAGPMTDGVQRCRRCGTVLAEAPGRAWAEGAPVRVRLRDRKGGDMQEWPADLRVREFPIAAQET